MLIFLKKKRKQKIQNRREQSRAWGMCRWGLTGLEGWKDVDDDDENNGIGSSTTRVGGLFFEAKIRLPFILKASAKSFWCSDCEGGFSMAFLPSTSM
jgi:hypothetical protein